MPPVLDRDGCGDTAAGKEIQHGRTRIGQCADEAFDQYLRLLGRMADALLRIAVEARDLPDVGRVDALVETFGIEALIALVDLEPLRIEWLADRVEVKIIFGRPGKPGDLFMPVGEEALRTHAVRIVPDDEIDEPHLAVRPHPAHQA